MVIKKSVKGVFFDLYGTLLIFNDFDKADNVWVNTFYNLIGKNNNLCLNEVKNICMEILECDIEKDLATGLTTYETKIKQRFQNLGIDFSVEELRKIADETVESWQKHICPAEDAIFVLKELKKTKRIALITNFDHSTHIRKVLAETSLEELFDLVVISDEAGCKKPDPQIFKIALSQTNLTPNEVIYVGDNLRDDIEGAFSAGIIPILINRNSKSNFHISDNLISPILQENQVINSLSQLLPLLN